jgi:hypothetical protein
VIERSIVTRHPRTAHRVRDAITGELYVSRRFQMVDHNDHRKPGGGWAGGSPPPVTQEKEERADA